LKQIGNKIKVKGKKIESIVNRNSEEVDRNKQNKKPSLCKGRNNIETSQNQEEEGRCPQTNKQEQEKTGNLLS